MKLSAVVLILGISILIGITSILETLYFVPIWTGDALAIRMEGGVIPKTKIPELSSKALKGSPQAANDLYYEYRFQRGENEEAGYWEEIGAENGDLFSQANIGYYMTGGYRGDRNRERGRFWLLKAANHEGDDSFKASALKHLKEIGQAPVPEDDPSETILPGNAQHFLSDKELARMKTKALAGSPEPAFRLYQFYENVSKDVAESRYWLRIAAQNDDPVGQYEFGLVLARDPDQKNQQRAGFWIERAATNGNPRAVEYLKNYPGE